MKKKLCTLQTLAFGLITILPVLLYAATFTVTSVGDEGDLDLWDGVCVTGIEVRTCTLRAAIEEANAWPGPDTITFNIEGQGPHRISPASAFPPIMEEVAIDGYTQPGARENTDATGDNAIIMIELDGGDRGDHGFLGLNIMAGGNIIRGLVINRFRGGISINSGDGNIVSGNFIGTNVTGTEAFPNSIGIGISSRNNTIGGTTIGDRNIISGNNEMGILVSDPLATGNLIQGNFIGIKANGRNALGNTTGIVLSDTSDNTIGGLGPGARNVISGNTDGITIIATDPQIAGNRVEGNYIGTDATGRVVLEGSVGQKFGVDIRAPMNTIGAANVISGNFMGIRIADEISKGNVVRGNFIGTDVSGKRALPNDYGVGIYNSASGNIVGGVLADECNIISGNSDYGLIIESNATANEVKNNWIGIDATGTNAIKNGFGLHVAIHGNTVGGPTSDDKNIIYCTMYTWPEIESGLNDFLPCQGRVQFLIGEYRVSEGSGNAVIEVVRLLGDGDAYVDYVLDGGTADSEDTTVEQKGTLSFGVGETQNNIVVPILDDSKREGDETIVLMLTNPTTGAELGDPSRVTLTIVDDEMCSDGFVDDTEGCDDGNLENTDTCLDTCVPAWCGDGFVWPNVEVCDDGNTSDGDGCSSACVVEVSPDVDEGPPQVSNTSTPEPTPAPTPAPVGNDEETPPADSASSGGGCSLVVGKVK